MALLRLAMLAAWVAGSWFLAHRALPWLAVRAGRVLGLALRPTPLTAKRLRRFREIRRGHAAFVLVTTAFTASLFLELSVNHKPLYIRYDDHVQLPALAEWGNFWLGWTGLAFHDRVAAKDHGLEGEQDLDARRYARWVTDPGLLEVEAAEIESEVASDEARFRRLMAEQAAARGLAYDAAEPLPEAKLADQASRQAEAARLRKLGSEIAAGRSAVLMPLYPYSPRERLLDLPGSPPHEPFQPGLPVLGTDFEGKEVVAQLLYGFRVGFAFALCVSLTGYAVGVLVGGAMGYFGGWLDIGVQRVIEVWSNIPFLFTMIIIASVTRPGFWLLALILVVLHGWTGITYTIRGEFYRERARDYVQAARALGVRDAAIMVRHILPNALVPVVTFLPFAIVGDMNALVSLDFLGFGLPPGTPSWGALLRQGSENIVNHPRLVVIPVLAFAGTLYAVVLVGEAVREAFDPKRYARLR